MPTCYIDGCTAAATLLVHDYPDDVRLCSDHAYLDRPDDDEPMGGERCTGPGCEACDVLGEIR